MGGARVMRPSHLAETLMLRTLVAGLNVLPRPAALAVGAGIGTAAGALGLRRRVARSNLALAFPEHDAAWHERVLHEHYRELGRTAADYARLPRLVQAPREQVFSRWEHEEYLHQARAHGRGVIMLTGHFGNFELYGAAMGRVHPIAIIVKPLSNPGAEAWTSAMRRACGVELLPIGLGVRAAVRRLRSGGVIAMVADQDARRDGVFVPFFGRPASTPTGPAWLSLATGAPIVFGTCLRGPDGRYEASLTPPLMPEGSASDPEAVRALTARHTVMLEAAVRQRPESWFWLHKRWKTAPPSSPEGE
jgi:KDO2-lipid IV(A) lauroyltransferase